MHICTTCFNLTQGGNWNPPTPVPSLGLGGAAPGITAGVRHCRVYTSASSALLRFCLVPGHTARFSCSSFQTLRSLGQVCCQIAVSMARRDCRMAPLNGTFKAFRCYVKGF